MGEPVVSVLMEVQRVDDAQRPVGGRQLRNPENTHMMLQKSVDPEHQKQ